MDTGFLGFRAVFSPAEQAVNKFRDRLEEVFADVRNPEVPADDEEYRLVPAYPAKATMRIGTATTAAEMARVTTKSTMITALVACPDMNIFFKRYICAV